MLKDTLMTKRYYTELIKFKDVEKRILTQVFPRWAQSNHRSVYKRETGVSEAEQNMTT